MAAVFSAAWLRFRRCAGPVMVQGVPLSMSGLSLDDDVVLPITVFAEYSSFRDTWVI